MTIYSKPNCKPCMEAKLLFKLKGIDYTEEPIIDNIDLLRDKGFFSAPVFQIGDYFTQDKSRAIELTLAESYA